VIITSTPGPEDLCRDDDGPCSGDQDFSGSGTDSSGSGWEDDLSGSGCVAGHSGCEVTFPSDYDLTDDDTRSDDPPSDDPSSDVDSSGKSCTSINKLPTSDDLDCLSFQISVGLGS
jgi:hypothetical protein